MGFIRRYQFFPSTNIITQIEGVIIVDQTPAGPISGINTGVVAIVGEFSDVTYGVAVDNATGAVSTFPQAVQIFSGQDLINKLGGFDSTIGDFGVSMGNGFVALQNKQFGSLVATPVNFCEANVSPTSPWTSVTRANNGVRLFRDLPPCAGATNPNPVVPVIAGTVGAGTLFKTSAGIKVNTAQTVTFQALQSYESGTDGVLVNSGSAEFQTFTSATGNFLVNGVQVGDILVLNNVATPTAGLSTSTGGTYRVHTVTDATNIDVERLDGQSFQWSALTALPWRIHPALAADSGGNKLLATVGGYTVPARALTNAASPPASGADGVITPAAQIPPASVPPATTATTWNPLGGLTMVIQPGAGTGPGAGGLYFFSAIAKPNAAASASIDALYTEAFAALLADQVPAANVNILIVARTSSTIRSGAATCAETRSATGTGMEAIIWPELTVQSLSNVLTNGTYGVGAVRNERVTYTWPGAQTFISQAANVSIKGADGNSYTTGIIDVPADAYLASVESNINPWFSPAQPNEPVPTLLSSILGLQRGAPVLGINEYTQMRASGICGLRIDRTTGPQFQSAVTTSLVAGETDINRRRMADYIEDSLAQALQNFGKQPLSFALQDAAVGQVDGFMSNLLSTANPAAQAISAYSVDDKSGNTPDLLALGIFVILVKVRMLPLTNFIVLQCQVGANVQVTQV